ncbi:hypothetical protein ACJ5H2_16075 [Nocardioides sp. R1-1]|uniref:hypothetical protein n=1 Tax=Nocardioides sp. R1-1 TaxID=3383502 RepID=UPI0038D1B2ED
MQNEGAGKVERYSSGGLVPGVVGLVLVAGTFGYGLFEPEAGFAPWAYPLCLLAGAAVWVVMVRPALRLHPDDVELRNILDSHRVPYALVTSVDIGHVTVVHAGDERYVGSGFGRGRRTMRQDKAASGDTPLEKRSTAWLIENRIERRAQAARDAASWSGATSQVRHQWAWVEIGVLATLAVATLVAALVG